MDLIQKLDRLPIIDGPKVEKFDRFKLAEAIEYELVRAKAMNLPKISLHMDLEDAYLLAQVLKR